MQKAMRLPVKFPIENAQIRSARSVGTKTSSLNG